MRRQGPLTGSYAAAVALVVFALVPFLSLSAALLPLGPVIAKSVGLSTHAFDLTVAMSDAAYAFGTVLAVQFAVHLPTRRMLLAYVTLFTVASVLAAWAPSGGVFAGALVAQGLCTSLMLIAAVPPLVTGWPARKMPVTGAVMNLCVFGAVAIGPTVGALQASSGGWRPLFWGVAATGFLALVFSLLTFEDDPAQDRSAPWDPVAIALAGGGCAAAFYGAGELESTKAVGAASLVPLVAGVAAIVALVASQYAKKNPLMPMKQLATTIPVSAIVVIMFASASAVGLMELVLTGLEPTGSLTHTAALFVPEFAAAVLTAALFGLVFRSRFTPLLALGGMVMLAIAALVLIAAISSGGGLIAVGAGLIGLGVGASVSPALFMSGFSLRSAQIQRVFAMIELLRGVTAFLVAPILLFVATVVGASPSAGIKLSMWVCFALAVAGGLLGGLVFYLGGGRLQVPDLERWQEDGEPAWDSPPLLGRLRAGGRGGHPEPAAPAPAEGPRQLAGSPNPRG